PEALPVTLVWIRPASKAKAAVLTDRGFRLPGPRRLTAGDGLMLAIPTQASKETMTYESLEGRWYEQHQHEHRGHDRAANAEPDQQGLAGHAEPHIDGSEGQGRLR